MFNGPPNSVNQNPDGENVGVAIDNVAVWDSEGLSNHEQKLVKWKLSASAKPGRSARLFGGGRKDWNAMSVKSSAMNCGRTNVVIYGSTGYTLFAGP